MHQATRSHQRGKPSLSSPIHTITLIFPPSLLFSHAPVMPASNGHIHTPHFLPWRLANHIHVHSRLTTHPHHPYPPTRDLSVARNDLFHRPQVHKTTHSNAPTPFTPNLHLPSLQSVQSALEDTTTTLRDATQPEPGTRNTKCLLNTLVGAFSQSRMGDSSAANGNVTVAALKLTNPSTFVQAVDPNPMEPNSVLELRSRALKTLYKVDEWHSALRSAGLLPHFHMVVKGLHDSFTVDFPTIHHVQIPPNKDSVGR